MVVMQIATEKNPDKIAIANKDSIATQSQSVLILAQEMMVTVNQRQIKAECTGRQGE